MLEKVIIIKSARVGVSGIRTETHESNCNSNEEYKQGADEGIILEHSILIVCPQAKDKNKSSFK